jgi:hypothetical protein
LPSRENYVYYELKAESEGLSLRSSQHVFYCAILAPAPHLAFGFQISDVRHGFPESKPLLRRRELFPGLSSYVPFDMGGYLEDILFPIAQGNQYFIQPGAVVLLQLLDSSLQVMHQAAVSRQHQFHVEGIDLLIPLRFQDGTNPRPVGQLSGC